MATNLLEYDFGGSLLVVHFDPPHTKTLVVDHFWTTMAANKMAANLLEVRGINIHFALLRLHESISTLLWWSISTLLWWHHDSISNLPLVRLKNSKWRPPQKKWRQIFSLNKNRRQWRRRRRFNIQYAHARTHGFALMTPWINIHFVYAHAYLMCTPTHRPMTSIL